MHPEHIDRYETNTELLYTSSALKLGFLNQISWTIIYIPKHASILSLLFEGLWQMYTAM